MEVFLFAIFFNMHEPLLLGTTYHLHLYTKVQKIAKPMNLHFLFYYAGLNFERYAGIKAMNSL